ncbi:MAG: alpha-L-fucosidase, partial [Spirochaetia bacterium]|nr:alpha-L-fucosidase [Spirochaetia bacterium]
MSDEKEVTDQHAQIGAQAGGKRDFQRNDHPHAAWFAEAGLGLFIHWGLSSVRGECDLSWGMMKREAHHHRQAALRHGLPAAQITMTPADYWEQKKGFLADRFDPVKILTAAQKAGCRYAVLTTKHHDGFTLWPSAFGELGVAGILPGRDLVKEYIDACRKTGLKVGLYFSPPDWHFDRHHMSFHYGGAKPDLGIHHESVTLPVLSAAEKESRLEAFRKMTRGQVEELLTRYGQIDVLWFDGAGHDAISTERLRELQPKMLFNPRAHGVGDFDTSECAFPKTRHSGWWEYCHLLADGGWGYLNHEIYKPLGWLLGEFAKARSWNGNFLPNVCPDLHGQLPDVFYQRMSALEAW